MSVFLIIPTKEEAAILVTHTKEYLNFFPTLGERIWLNKANKLTVDWGLIGKIRTSLLGRTQTTRGHIPPNDVGPELTNHVLSSRNCP